MQPISATEGRKEVRVCAKLAGAMQPISRGRVAVAESSKPRQSPPNRVSSIDFEMRTTLECNWIRNNAATCLSIMRCGERVEVGVTCYESNRQAGSFDRTCDI